MKFVFLHFFIFYSLLVAAQKSSFGLYGFKSFTDIDIKAPKDVDNFNYQSFSGGAFFVFPIQGVLYFQSEICYLKQGYKHTDLLGNVNHGQPVGYSSRAYEFNRISIPVMARVFARDGKDGFFLLTGVAPCFNIYVKEDYVYSDGVSYIPGTSKLKDVPALGLAAILGGGFDAEITKRINLMVGLRYQYDLTNAFIGENDDDNGKFRTASLMFGIRYKFSFKTRRHD